MTNNIVTVNVSSQAAPYPSTLQRTGAIISQGGTNTAAGTLSLITQPSDLTPILQGARAISTMVLSAGIVTVTTAAPHGFTTGDSLPMVIAGVTPSAYNGTFTATVTGASTFTYPLAGAPGSVTVQGVYTDADAGELLSQVTTFFSNGQSVSVYVLELGPGTPAEGVTALNTFIVTNPFYIYGWLLPREWGGEPTFVPMAKNYASNTALVYFYLTLSVSNYAAFLTISGSSSKSIRALVEAPGIPSTEFSMASVFWTQLNYNPSTTNRVTPAAFAFVNGVTPYPTFGTSVLRSALKAANINIIGTGAEGNISNTLVLWGTGMDGFDMTYWYSVDAVQIYANIDLSNEVINGSNNPVNPLYYNQDGINRLQARAQGTMNRMIAWGLALSPVTVNAVGFVDYVTVNESDYPIGKYAGLSVTYTPARGFIQIIFNVVVTDFVIQ